MTNTTENTKASETKPTCDCGNKPLSNETPGIGMYEENGVAKYQCGYCWAAANYGGETTTA